MLMTAISGIRYARALFERGVWKTLKMSRDGTDVRNRWMGWRLLRCDDEGFAQGELALWIIDEEPGSCTLQPVQASTRSCGYYWKGFVQYKYRVGTESYNPSIYRFIFSHCVCPVDMRYRIFVYF